MRRASKVSCAAEAGMNGENCAAKSCRPRVLQKERPARNKRRKPRPFVDACVWAAKEPLVRPFCSHLCVDQYSPSHLHSLRSCSFVAVSDGCLRNGAGGEVTFRGTAHAVFDKKEMVMEQLEIMFDTYWVAQQVGGVRVGGGIGAAPQQQEEGQKFDLGTTLTKLASTPDDKRAGAACTMAMESVDANPAEFFSMEGLKVVRNISDDDRSDSNSTGEKELVVEGGARRRSSRSRVVSGAN